MKESTIFEYLLKIIEEYHLNRRQGRFLDYHHPEELGDLLQLDGKNGAQDWQEIFEYVEKYLRYSVKSNHPSFVNRMWTGANLPSIVGEIVTAVSNTSACTFESAPVSTLMEKYMIEQMLELVGFERGEGQMTTGSSNANMIAMMAARNSLCDGAKQAGLFGQKPLFALVGADSHYSMDKAANILGIGIDHLIKVRLAPSGEMDLEDLRNHLVRVKSEGGLPFFVAATAGTTVRGAYDSITPLLVLRKEFGFWLHVDGAWGGAAVMSPVLRERFLPGLVEADSFTWDFHKMLGAALMCNILLINKSNHTLGTVLSGGDGSYLFRDENRNDVDDLGTISLQCGRRVDGLKWFLDWKYYGREGFAKRIERYLGLCEYAEEIVKETPELEMVVPRNSFNICFRYVVDKEESNRINLAIRDRLYKNGISLVGIAYIDGKVVMRLLVTNPESGRDDVKGFFQGVVEAGNELVGGH